MKQLFAQIPSLCGNRLLLRPLQDRDAEGLRALTLESRVYRYLPTFLFEKQYADPHATIAKLYDECLRDSLILGVFKEDRFCGLAEMYGYRQPICKISVGYRLREAYWGQGIATEALGLMVDYLLHHAGIEIITASTMIENQASANVLKKMASILSCMRCRRTGAMSSRSSLTNGSNSACAASCPARHHSGLTAVTCQRSSPLWGGVMRRRP